MWLTGTGPCELFSYAALWELACAGICCGTRVDRIHSSTLLDDIARMVAVQAFRK